MNKLWACLLHLGMKMWPGHNEDKLEFDRSMWDDLTEKLAENGCNCIVLDIGEGMRFDCCPEIAVSDAWTKDEMRAELERLRGMGFEVIPKLNFSCAHDMWLGKYAWMMGTDEYYRVVRELIAETCELFKPRFFHIGMDEENASIQAKYDFIRIRQNDLWWNDLYFYIDCVEKGGARPMMWSDYARHKPDEYVEKCPMSVVQCNWYYYNIFDNMEEEKYRIRLTPFLLFEEKGYDQLPTGTNFWDSNRENIRLLTMYSAERIADERLFGVMQTPWVATMEKNREKLMTSAQTLKEAREAYEEKYGK